jgi:hypothetical protein
MMPAGDRTKLTNNSERHIFFSPLDAFNVISACNLFVYNLSWELCRGARPRGGKQQFLQIHDAWLLKTSWLAHKVCIGYPLFIQQL